MQGCVNMARKEVSIVVMEALSRFKAIRLERSESAAVFGAFVGVSASTVHRWENPNDNSNATSNQLAEICHRCDISPSWLLFGMGVKELSEINIETQQAAAARDGARLVERIASAAVSLEKIENSIAKLALKAAAEKEAKRS
jgi:transcriptional regulator with XRE-family HTH domain